VKRRVAALALLAAEVLACHNQSGREISVGATLCAIAEAPRAYEERLVTINATLVSTGRDGVRLVDRSCPDVAMLLIPANRGVDRSVRDLMVALTSKGRLPTTSGRDMSGKFTGIFRETRGGVPRLTLELRRVEDWKITLER